MKKSFIVSAGLSLVVATSLIGADTIDKMVVTSKSKQAIFDTAGSITIVTQEDIEEMNASSIQDVLEEVAGVSIGVNDSSFGGRESISIRGAESKHSLILIDGKRISGSDAQIGHSDFQYNWLPLSAVKKIEVVRGPMSSLYGSKGIGGVVNIITKKPEKLEGSLNLKYGQNASDGEIEKDISFTIGGKITENFGAALFAEKKDHELVLDKNGSGATKREGKKVTNTMLNLWLDLDDTQKISLSYLKGNETRENTVYKKATKTYNVLDKYYDIDKQHYSLTYQKNFEDLTLDVKYYNTKSDSHTDEYLYTHELEDNVINVEASIDKIDNNFVIIGVENRKESYNKIYDLASKASSNFENEIDYKSAYIQDEIEVSDKLILTLGTRYDKHEKFGAELSPKANIVYKLSDNNRLKLGYGHGFNAPTLSQNSSAYTVSAAHVFNGNDDLKAETSDTYEIGFEHESEKNTFKATAFHTKITNLIEGLQTGTQTPYPSMPTYVQKIYLYSNVDEATMDGVELEYSKKDLLSNLDLKFSYNYLKTEDKKTGKELIAKPKQKANLKLSYKFPFKIKGNVRVKYTGTQKAYDASDVRYTQTAYTTYAFQVSKEFTKGLSAKLGAENLGNTKLENDANYNIKQRVVYASLNYKF